MPPGAAPSKGETHNALTEVELEIVNATGQHPPPHPIPSYSKQMKCETFQLACR